MVRLVDLRRIFAGFHLKNAEFRSLGIVAEKFSRNIVKLGMFFFYNNDGNKTLGEDKWFGMRNENHEIKESGIKLGEKKGRME